MQMPDFSKARWSGTKGNALLENGKYDVWTESRVRPDLTIRYPNGVTAFSASAGRSSEYLTIGSTTYLKLGSFTAENAVNFSVEQNGTAYRIHLMHSGESGIFHVAGGVFCLAASAIIYMVGAKRTDHYDDR